MGYKRSKFEQKGFDEKLFKRYFHQKQAEYIRVKLRCIQFYHQGKEFEAIAEILSIHHQSVRKYVNTYISSGFEGLCQEVIRPQSSLLSCEQSANFKEVLLSKRPNEVGLSGNIWTGELMCQYLKQVYNVVYKSGIYDLLERLNLSHRSGEPSKSSCRLC